MNPLFMMLDRAIADMQPEEGVASVIKACNAVLQVQFPVKSIRKIART